MAIMSNSYRSWRTLEGASAALSLLQLTTEDKVFATQSIRLPIPFPRKPSTCDVCFGQSIQRKNSQLYHVKLIKEHIRQDPEAHVYTVTIHGTFTDQICARNAAYTALELPETFQIHHSRRDLPEHETWQHGDDVYVRALAHTGEIFTLSVHAEPNHSNLIGDTHGEVCGTLFYALQQAIHYTEDRRGYQRASIIRGHYSTRTEARSCIVAALLDDGRDPKDFPFYEVFSETEETPWGTGVVVRAVAENGDTFLLSIFKSDRASSACGD